MPAVLPTPATLTPLPQSCGSPQSSEYVRLRPLRERISGPLPLPSMIVTCWLARSNEHVDAAEGMAGGGGGGRPRRRSPPPPVRRRAPDGGGNAAWGAPSLWGSREVRRAPLRSLSAAGSSGGPGRSRSISLDPDRFWAGQNVRESRDGPAAARRLAGEPA